MARPALRKATRPAQAGGSRLAHLDLDRALVDAARVDPARFDALYRKYVAHVYNFAVYELGDHHEAEDATDFLNDRVALRRRDAAPGEPGRKSRLPRLGRADDRRPGDVDRRRKV